jgi:outer membrane protein assembly factor BamB
MGEQPAVAYAVTRNGCGSQPDGVWAMDLGSTDKKVTAFQPEGALIAGHEGAALGRDGVVYVATREGASPMSSSVIALEPKTLKVRARARVPNAAFSSTPLVFQAAGKDVIAIAGGGRVFLFDSGSLESGPVATSAVAGDPGYDAGALASWQDAQGVRWLAVPTEVGIAALRVADQAGKLALEPAWTSTAIPSPLPPLVVNGVLFTASAGTRTTPAVLHAIDAATGKDLWNSAKTITSRVSGGLSAGGGNVYVPGADSTLYAFGFEIEK